MGVDYKDYWDRGEYTPSDKVKELESKLNDIMGRKPGDFDKSTNYAPVQSALDAYNNRGKFSYDINGDMLYQQYKDRYITQGKQAMMDAMGQASALTGGYGNSYAATVGQQTYQGYLQGLNDKVPELYQLALDKYNQEGQDLLTRYGLEKDKYDTAYGEWQDAVSRWNTDREYAENAYNTERAYDYGMYTDAYQMAMDKLQLGVTKDTDGNEVLPTSSSLKTPTSEMLLNAAKAYEEGGEYALNRYVASFEDYDTDKMFAYIKDNNIQQGLAIRTYTKTKDTDNGLFNWGKGVDADDEVTDQYGNVYRIEELPEEIRMALTNLKEGESYNKQQGNLGKSSQSSSGSSSEKKSGQYTFKRAASSGTGIDPRSDDLQGGVRHGGSNELSRKKLLLK